MVSIMRLRVLFLLLACLLFPDPPEVVSAKDLSSLVRFWTEMRFTPIENATFGTPAFANGVVFQSRLQESVKPQDWQIFIMRNKETIQRFAGKGPPPERILWMGVTLDGKVVQESFYSAFLRVSSLSGRTLESAPIDVSLDQPTPMAALWRRDFRFLEDAFKIVIMIPSLTFQPNQTELDPGAFDALDALADYLKQYLHTKILVLGFTDSTGSNESNQRISWKRARAVYSFLVEDRGLPSEVIRFHGLGKRIPLRSNATAQGRFANRRVEVWLSKVYLQQ